MTIRKIVFATALLLFSVTLYSQDYTDLKTTLGKWSGVMSRHTEKVNNCDDIGKLSDYCSELADTITLMTPSFKKLAEKYPDMRTEGPPEELKDFFTKVDAITVKFGDMTQKLTKLANENSENEVFQKAYGKLNMAMFYMNR